jgi:hypothetical protein
MKKKSLLLIILGALVLVCCLLPWALNWLSNSPSANEYWLIHRRDRYDTEISLAFAFSTALRINHPAAYDMIDPSLKPRLDAWMNVHQVRRCTEWANFPSSGSGSKEGYITYFSCPVDNHYLDFDVDNIVIEDMKVIDWGEVIEEYD